MHSYIYIQLLTQIPPPCLSGCCCCGCCYCCCCCFMSMFTIILLGSNSNASTEIQARDFALSWCLNLSYNQLQCIPLFENKDEQLANLDTHKHMHTYS